MTLARLAAWSSCLALLVAAVALAVPLSPVAHVLVGNLAQLGAAGAASAACAAAAWKGPLDHRPAWAACAVGCAFWTLGGLIYFREEFVSHDPDFPSAADVGYLTFALVGVLTVALLAGGPPLRRCRDLFDGVMTAAAISAVVWCLALSSWSPVAGDAREVPRLLSAAYPLLDVVVVVMAVAAVRSGPPATMVMLAAGFAFTAAADTAYAVLVDAGTYVSGGLTDLGWIAGFAAVALAAAFSRSGPVRARPGRDLSAGRLLVPFMLVLVGFGVVGVSMEGGGRDRLPLWLLLLAGLAALARHYVSFLEQARLACAVDATEAELWDRARRDPLTRLPNRLLFGDQVRQQLLLHAGLQRPLAVIFCDIDDFKGVNDALGHAVGDELLTLVAERLKAVLGGAHELARLGGDEFAALLNGSEPAQAWATGCSFVEVTRAPFRVCEYDLQIELSVGVAAVAGSDDSPSLDELLTRADVAMYSAKRAGGGRAVVHRLGMTVRESRDLLFRIPLAEAVERNEIVLHYQPIMELATGRVMAFEALARWNVNGTAINPEEFIPLARRTGLLSRLTDNLLERVCGQLAEWAVLSGHRRVVVGVNISPDQIADRDLPDRLQSLLHRYGVRAGQLNIEITEEALLTDLEGAAAVVGRLKAMGVGLSLDDFGTGYSSLSHLHQLPSLDSLKIDRSFVHRIDHDAGRSRLVQAVLALGNGLGLGTIAEGIETREQEQVLLALGCQAGQGYLYARPKPAEELTHMLSTLALPVQRTRDHDVA